MTGPADSSAPAGAAKFSHRAMDTVFMLMVRGADAALAAGAAAAVFARIDELERLLTRFSDSSDVAVVRGLAPGRTAVVARETMDLLVESARACAATRGAFDPTVKRRNFGDLVLDPDHCRVAVKGRVELDFGGIGKGFALDECARILAGEQFGLDDWLFDAGTSTIRASAPAGGHWPLGVGGRWKRRTRRETVAELSSGALSGSGFEIQGAHVFDPRTGRPATRWAQSWAFAPTGAMADALSTAALALAPSELRAACAALGARVLVAREQPRALDFLRDPLAAFGDWPAPTGERA
ncbi:MAG: FAD:protein FMN transferase [Kiritimatiellae bacterium]|nr:FAD:protein FMN transferase [Kiritimatiellia bacterium]